MLLTEKKEAGVRTQVAVSPLLPGDAGELARALEPVADRVVVDDFFEGDGASGHRSKAALAKLRALGYADYCEPGYARDTLATLRSALGAERVVYGKAGFNDTRWLREP